MIPVKEAISNSIRYMNEIYGPLDGLLVEEVELDEPNRQWVVTMGFWQMLPPQEKPTNPFALVLAEPRRVKRLYKELRLGAVTGEVLSMKIRVLPNVDPK